MQRSWRSRSSWPQVEDQGPYGRMSRTSCMFAPVPLCPAAGSGGAVIASTEAGVLGDHARDVHRQVASGGDQKNGPIGAVIGGLVLLSAVGLFAHVKSFCLPRSA